MNSNLFNRLSSGQNWLDNSYSQENVEDQAKKYAQRQVGAIQAQAADILREKIGDSAVEAVVGAGAIAAPYLKRALNMSGGTSGVTDKVSDAVGNVSKQIKQGIRGVQETAQTAREQARQAVQKASQQAQDISDQGQGVVERIQKNIKVRQFDPQAAAVPEEAQTALAKTASRLDQLDIPTVSVPQPERLARSQANQALRERAEQEFGQGAEDTLREIPQPKFPSEPGVFDPFSLSPKKVEETPESFPGVSGTPEVAEGGFDDEAESQARMAAERFDLPTIQDYKKVDAIKKASALPDVEDLQRESDATKAREQAQPIEEEEIKPYTPPSQQTGGLDPSTLPEGAGARGAGGQAIPATRPAAQPIQQRGLQDTAFEQDPEEDIRTGQKLEDVPSQEELFKPIQITAKPDEPDEPDEPEGFGEAEEEPTLEQQEKKAEPDEPEEEPEGFGEDIAKTVGKDVGEDVGEDIGEEAAAAAVPGIGEAAIAAVGIGQLISGLINKHKENEEEQSAAAAQMNQPEAHVALDASPVFDSTFR